MRWRFSNKRLAARSVGYRGLDPPVSPVPARLARSSTRLLSLHRLATAWSRPAACCARFLFQPFSARRILDQRRAGAAAAAAGSGWNP